MLDGDEPRLKISQIQSSALIPESDIPEFAYTGFQSPGNAYVLYSPIFGYTGFVYNGLKISVHIG